MNTASETKVSFMDCAIAHWLVEFSKIGAHIFAEITIEWVEDYINDPRPDEEIDIYEDFLFKMEECTSSARFFELATSNKAKRIFYSKIKNVLEDIRDKRKKGTPFDLSKRDLFRGRWFLTLKDRVIANNTFDHALKLLKSGRRDTQKMAEDIWHSYTQTITAAETNSLNNLDNMGFAGIGEFVTRSNIQKMTDALSRFAN